MALRRILVLSVLYGCLSWISRNTLPPHMQLIVMGKVLVPQVVDLNSILKELGWAGPLQTRSRISRQLATIVFP
jgi:hypothetical protein